MEQIAILMGLAFAANKTVTVLKYLFTPNRSSAFTQFMVWGVSFLGLLLASEAEVTENLLLPGMSVALGLLDVPSIIILAWIAGSSGSVVYDFKKALDQSDTAVEPPLFPLTTPPPHPGGS